MKLHALQDRRADRPEKSVSDCRDLYFLLEAFDRDGSIGGTIAAAPAPLAALVLDAARRELVDGAVRLERNPLVYSQGTPQPPRADDLVFVGQRLIGVLEEHLARGSPPFDRPSAKS